MTAKRSYSYIASELEVLTAMECNTIHVVSLMVVSRGMDHERVQNDATYDGAESFPESRMPNVVYGAMLMDAGKRIAASIFRAYDLSFVLCSNR